MKRSLASFAASMLLLASASFASAAPIQVFFTADVLQTTGLYSPGPAGTTAYGSLTFDPDSLSAANPGQLQIVSGYGTQTFPFAGISISDGPSSDSWGTGGGVAYPTGSYFDLVLTDATGTVISSPDPFVPTSLEGWTSADMYTWFKPLGLAPIMTSYSQITSWTVVPAPEPAAFASLGAALLLLALGRSRAR